MYAHRSSWTCWKRDMSGNGGGLELLERRGKLHFFQSNETAGWHIFFVMAKSFLLVPVEIWNLGGIVRFAVVWTGPFEAPSLSTANEREGSCREWNVEVCLRLSSNGLFHVISFTTGAEHRYWPNLYCKLTFLGCTFWAFPLPKRSFELCYRNTNSLSLLRLLGWANSVKLSALQWVKVKKEVTSLVQVYCTCPNQPEWR